MLYVPAPRLEMLADAFPAASSDAVARTVPPAVKTTEPNGVRYGEVTVLLKLIGEKAMAGFGDTEREVVVGSPIMICTTTFEALLSKLKSPG